MRNTGWYIPFWRKPKRSQGDATQPERNERRRRPRTRSDDDVEQVREEWVSRYTSRVRALKALGLSVGAPQEEIAARYRLLVSELDDVADNEERLHTLRDAYEMLRAES